MASTLACTWLVVVGLIGYVKRGFAVSIECFAIPRSIETHPSKYNETERQRFLSLLSNSPYLSFGQVWGKGEGP